MAEAAGVLVGFVFGYSLRPDRGWWGLAPDPPEGFTVETGDRTVVLAEIEVRRAWQGKGLGRALHDGFLGSRRNARMPQQSWARARPRHEAHGEEKPKLAVTHAVLVRAGDH